jgi:tight adherence protein B
MSLEPTTLLIVAGGLGLLLLVVGVLVATLGKGSVVEERLGRYAESGGFVTTAGDDKAVLAERPGPITEFLDRLGEGTDLYDNLAQGLARADLKFRPAEFVALMILSAVVVGALGALLSRAVGFTLLSVAAGLYVPFWYLHRAQRRRLKEFNDQLGDMLNLVVNGLRAGYSTLMALEAVGRELPDPISTEFRRVVQEIQLGIPMEDALAHLVRRIDSDDLDMIITAIEVQREVGGNLAEILDTISHTIRERVRIKGEIQALTAQGQITAWALSLMPVGLSLLLYLINRDYMGAFFAPETRSCGIPMLVLAAVMVIAGFFVTQKIVDIDI